MPSAATPEIAANFQAWHNAYMDFAADSWAPSTQRVYDSWIQKLHAFAERSHLSDALPLNPTLLQLFFGELAETGATYGFGVATAAFVRLHQLHDLPHPFAQSSLLWRVVQHAHKLQKAKRQPLDTVPVEMISALALIEDTLTSTWQDMRDKALLMVAWHAMLRVSEAGTLRVCQIRLVKHPPCWAVKLGRTKTDQAGVGTPVYLKGASHQSFFAPCWLQKWLNMRFPKNTPRLLSDTHPTDCTLCAPLWSLFQGQGGISGRAIGRLVNLWAAHLGFKGLHLSGASLRAGGATAAFDAGCSVEQVMDAGHWRTASVPQSIYRRPDILARLQASSALGTAVQRHAQVVPSLGCPHSYTITYTCMMTTRIPYVHTSLPNSYGGGAASRP